MDDILKEAEKAFNVHINNCIKEKSDFLLDTDKGRMLFKRQHIRREKIVDLAELTEYLHGSGFTCVERYLYNKKEPYLCYGGSLYTLVHCGEGSNCDFTKLNQAIGVAEALAKLHMVLPHSSWETLAEAPTISSQYYIKRISEIRHIKKWIDKQSSYTDADVLFIKTYRAYLKKACESAKDINNYAKSKYRRLCLNTIKEGNILIDTESRATFINAEKFVLSMPLVDLCELVKRYIKRGGDITGAHAVIEAYSREKPLNIEEYAFIDAFLSFPHKFFSLCNAYYNSNRVYGSSSTYAKLKNCVSHQNKINEMLISIKNAKNIKQNI